MSTLQFHSLPELHERFCQESLVIRNLSKETIRFYKNGFTTLMRFKSFKKYEELDESEMMNFLFWGKQKCGWAATSMYTHYKSLACFFKWCVSKGVGLENPLENVPKPKLPKALPKSLSEKDAMKLYEYAQILPIPDSSSQPIYQKSLEVAVLATFLFPGIRRQELLNLKLDDVNLEEDLISVIEGKGMKDRVIPIPFELKRVLQRYVKERTALEIFSPYFFSGHKYRRQLAVRTVTRFFRRLKDASGIDFSAHKLRHTFATLMLHSKCDLFSLSKIMGHSDIKTTTIYLSANNEQLKKQLNNHPLNFL